ncbi:unnamed protein product [Linum tenue]|uniref:Secreted protein n=1 Tax=Linum tenue TaxID=586396 RepID=A0AAV0LK23_9ROSI|nr:unnamed protein product [Linum tenue]
MCTKEGIVALFLPFPFGFYCRARPVRSMATRWDRGRSLDSPICMLRYEEKRRWGIQPQLVHNNMLTGMNRPTHYKNRKCQPLCHLLLALIVAGFLWVRSCCYCVLSWRHSIFSIARS